MSNDEWIEAGGGSSDTIWDRQSVLTGKYVGSKTDVGPNKSMLYTFETEDGNVGAWGATVLDDRMSEIPVGSRVRIECLGKKTSKSGSSFTDFKVQYQPPKNSLADDAQRVFNGQGE